MQQKINLYQVRDFSALFNVVFSFLRQNAKDLLRALFSIVFPVIILGVLVTGIIQGNMLSSFFARINNPNKADFSAPTDQFLQEFTAQWIASMSLNALLALLLYVFIALTVLVYVKIYQAKAENDEERITPKQVWTGVKPYILKACGATVLLYFTCLFGALFCILPGIFLGISLILILPVLVMENLGVIESLKKSYYLTKQNWWFTFGFVLVLYILSSVLVSFLYLPPYFIFIFSMLFGVDNPQVILENLQQNILWILTTVYLIVYLGSLISYTILQVGFAFQYGNLVEQKEAVGLQREIDQN